MAFYWNLTPLVYLKIMDWPFEASCEYMWAHSFDLKFNNFTKILIWKTKKQYCLFDCIYSTFNRTIMNNFAFWFIIADHFVKSCVNVLTILNCHSQEGLYMKGWPLRSRSPPFILRVLRLSVVRVWPLRSRSPPFILRVLRLSVVRVWPLPSRSPPFILRVLRLSVVRVWPLRSRSPPFILRVLRLSVVLVLLMVLQV